MVRYSMISNGVRGRGIADAEFGITELLHYGFRLNEIPRCVTLLLPTPTG